MKSKSNVKVCGVKIETNGEIVLCIETQQGKRDNKQRDYVFETEININISDSKSLLNSDISICEYITQHLSTSTIKDKTKKTYLHVYNYLREYGDCSIKSVTTHYLQKFIDFLQTKELKKNTVNLYFQKLCCVLRHAYHEELFDIRILKQVKKPKKNN